MDCPKADHSIDIAQNDGKFIENTPLDVLYYAGLFCISSASIAFEINLTRLFSVAQFYHFAFMIVSTALLGNAASGILIMVFPKIGKSSPKLLLTWSALCAGVSMIVAYLLFNHIPFDSFSVSWDIRQARLLLFHYFLLSLPFLFCGITLSFLLSAFPQNTGKLYSINLTGSALGCIFALVLPGTLGGDGIVIFCSGLAAIGAILFGFNTVKLKSTRKNYFPNTSWVRAPVIIAFMVILLAGTDFGFRFFDQSFIPWMTLKISPYKWLSQVMQIPYSKLLTQKWNAFSRIDLVESSAIRSLPGLSYRYQSLLPRQNGLFVDGDDMSPILISDEVNAFYDYLPLNLAFQLRPQAKTLILEPRGGLDILTAIHQGACCVTAIEQNPLIVSMAEDVYKKSQVKALVEFERSYLKRTSESYDVILVSLTNGYHPIQSGAYSLAEDYRYTVEAFQDSLNHLTETGLLIFMRWLQYPPSEDFRAFALAVETLDRSGGDARNQVVAFRGYNTAVVMIKRTPYTSDELIEIREFCSDRAFDLSYIPGINPEETNRYNILPESIYYQSYLSLIESKDRQSYYKQY
ncbi:MAG: hypothetical protein GYA34_07700, partial [Chloroflexi bacterium]|nr:hypothetical protein [Chloroflexota bacterium]